MRLLFTSWPATGHLLPMVPLARAAQRSGHEVVFVTGRDSAGLLEQRRFEVWPAGPTLADAYAILHAAHPDRATASFEDQIRSAAIHLFGKPGAQRAADSVDRVREFRPDIILHEPTDSTGAVLGRWLGVPSVVHGYGPLPGMMRGFGQMMFDATGESGLAAEVFGGTYLDVCPPGLQFDPTVPWGHRRLLRPSAGEVAPGDRLPREIKAFGRARTVYLTLGTVSNTVAGALTTALEAIQRFDVNIIVTTGPGNQPDLGDLPSHVVVHEFLPQALVLGHVDAVVAHGGAGTVLGALCHGLPQVCVPLGADQPENARALAAAGAGVVVGPERFSADAIAEALGQVLNQPRFRAAAKVLQAQIAAMPPAKEVLDGLLTDVASAAA